MSRIEKTEFSLLSSISDLDIHPCAPHPQLVDSASKKPNSSDNFHADASKRQVLSCRCKRFPKAHDLIPDLQRVNSLQLRLS